MDKIITYSDPNYIFLSGVFISQFYIPFNKWDTAEACISNIIETVLSLEETKILPDLSIVGGNKTGERLYYVVDGHYLLVVDRNNYLLLVYE